MKYVLVTGAGGGMGQAVVECLHEKGYTVFALDKNPVPEKDRLICVQSDITSEESVKQAMQKVRCVTERLHAIVHLAGIYMLDSFVEISDTDLERAFQINVFGACRVNRLFLPMLDRGSRIMIVTSELAPLDPLPFTGLYAVTKSTLDKYAYSLRMELQLKGIAVTVLRPGAVSTQMLKVSTDALDAFCANTKLYSCNAKRFRRIVDSVEAKHVPPEKVANKISDVLNCRRPRFIYTLNRNPLLLLLNILPPRLQTRIIGRILK